MLSLNILPTSFAGPVAFAPMRMPAVRMQDTPAAPPAAAKKFNPNDFVRTLPGISGPFGYFNPAGFFSNGNEEGAATEGTVRYYRESELKHGRVAMLAAVGFPLAEVFHPLFGGNIDVPSFIAYQQTPLQPLWPAVVSVIGIIEVLTTFPAMEDAKVEDMAIKSSHTAGDFGFDPLGLKPKTAAEYNKMATKELNNGRLAMLAIAGMVGQELATGKTLF